MRLIRSILRVSGSFAALALLAGLSVPAFAGEGARSALNNKERAAVRPAAVDLKVPMYFEANRGQADPSVKFFTHAAGYKLYLTSSEAVTVLPRAGADTAGRTLEVRMKLKGANADPKVQGLEVLTGRTSYLLGGGSAGARTGAAQYAKVKLSQVYPGIDMVYRFEKGNVEYDFVVAPGANPGRILMGFEGGRSLRLDPKGNLVLGVEGGELTYKAPKLYQMLGAERVPVKGSFVLAGNRNARFEVGDYIKEKELVIDPELVYSTYLGGSVNDQISAIAVDAVKQAYVTGWSVSDPSGVSGFPAAGNTSPAPIGANKGGKDVFVAKLSADGTALLWLAWLGGNVDDMANGIALEKTVSGTPKVYITGVTASAGAGTAFPEVGNPTVLQTCENNLGTRAFVTELGQPGNIPSLVYSTCWGGASASDTGGNSIAVDSLGAAYVTGTTFASDFPVVGATGIYAAMGGSQDAFVFKIAPAGTSVAYSMFLGPTSGITNGNAIAVDADFHAWVAGMTTSDTLPATLHHFANTRVGSNDAFVAQVDAAGTGLLYATYINGNVYQAATAIALNNGGAVPYNVFVTGYTNSDTDFPSTAYLLLPVSVRPAVYQKTLVGPDWDPFILRLNPFETAVADPANPLEMVYATHLGAVGADKAFALALDSRDDAYIAGWTLSSDWVISTTPPDPVTACSFPCVSINATPGKLMGNTAGGQLAFAAAIGPTGQYQPFFTYLGATDPGTAATGIAIDPAHNIYVAGYTPNADFPLVTGSLMDGSVPAKQINGTGTAVVATDGFITKIAPILSFGAPAAPVCTITGIDPGTGFAAGGTTVTIVGTGFYGFSAPGDVSFDWIAASTYTVNASSTVITAVTPRHPLTGALAAGSVLLRVKAFAGTCSRNYVYAAAPATCGKDYFFPSPATGATGNFAYCMAQAGTVRVRIYNAIGDLVAKLEDPKPAGPQLSQLNTARLAPGVYLYRLEKDYGGGNSTISGVKKFAVQR